MYFNIYYIYAQFNHRRVFLRAIVDDSVILLVKSSESFGTRNSTTGNNLAEDAMIDKKRIK